MRLLPIALLLALAVGPAAAATFNVNKLDVDLPDANPGDGICHVAGGASGEDCTLRAAIMEANANAGADTIIVPSAAHIVLGIPGRNEDAGATGDLDITSALTITTPLITNAERATIDAGGIDRVFDIAGTGDITLQNLDLTGGLANDAIYPWGGAIKVDGSGNLTIAHCEIHDNLANGGGAIDTTPGDRGVTIRSSYLHDNTAADLGHGGPEGSAILAGHSGSSGYLYLVNSTVSNNHGPGTSSHAIFSSSLLIIHNCTLDGNLPAAIEASNASVELASVTISGSNFDYLFSAANGGYTSVMRNVILADAGHWACVIDTTGNTIDHAYTLAVGEGCQLDAGSGNLEGIDPLLKPLARNRSDRPVHTLALASPAIDSGDPDMAGAGGACFPNDEDGTPRPLDGDDDGIARCDMGAIEYDDQIFADGFDTLPVARGTATIP